ncbi:UNVERIFIED_CONTAM: hypothetical protein Sradi_7200300 [Sesamum radiatum]|uniref:Reverse transcriptase domain-containing protein n=1 Tax=Sesamum radiatum TaxID=300843 RepID=A0AAW2IQN8_SESRA
MFRFDNYLARSAEFIPSVRRIWQHNIVGTAMYGVTRKLKALKPVFRAQRQKKGDLSNNVRLAASFLEEAQSLLAQDRHCELLLHLEFCCKLVMRLASRLEQHMLQQRAKMAWMKDGDQCSRIFFRKVAKRRSSKRVFQITGSDGQTCTSPSEVTDTFIEYYQNLLGGHRRTHLMDLRYLRPWARHILSEDDARLLVRPVSPNEVKQAIFDIDETKAPGPDGYSSAFFKAAWQVVGGDVTCAIMEFFRTGRLLRQVNATLITLIPKVSNPTVVGEFRPISCCNVLYKVITKILVQRMRGILDKLVSPTQNAFVPGRSISDNILLAQELFSGYNQRHLPPRCALKVDLRKPMTRWNGISYMRCSHYLGFRHNLLRGLWSVSAHRRTQCVLMDCRMDSLVVLEDCDRETQCLHSYLSLLWSASFTRRPPCYLGFSGGHLPLRYLGLPLLASRLTIADCQPILRKIDDRIKGWEGIMLSFAGRVQLIKSVLSALQVYWAMAFILPKHIIKEIEKRLRRFLWKGSTDVGYAKVSWQQVCRPTCEGGLGIRDLHALNKGLMSRHLWRIIVADRSSIWVDWIFRYRLRDALSGRFRPILVHGDGGNWYGCGIHCDRPSCIELGMVLPSLFGMTPGMNGAPYSSLPLGTTAHGYTRSGSPVRGYLRRRVELAPHLGYGEYGYHTLPSHYTWAGIALFGQAQGAAAYAIYAPPFPKVVWSSLLVGTFKIPRQRFILWLAILHRLSTLDRPWLQHMGTTCVLCQDDLPETHEHLFFSCTFATACIQAIRSTIFFPWPVRDWSPAVQWAARRWRGKHVVNASFRALLASLVYHLA